MDRSAYDRFFELEQTHFWRIAKRRLIMEWFERYGPGRSGLRILDVGGACSLIPGEFGRWGKVSVIEPDRETVEFARAKLGLDIVTGMFPADLPFEGQFDVVTMFDVLEHIEDDATALARARELLLPGGLLMVTVPALGWLWSDHDVVLHHHRRYSRGQLKTRLESAGFTTVRLSYYTGLLLPALVLQRAAGRLKSAVTGRRKMEYDVKPPPGPVNRLFGAVMTVERRMLRWFDCAAGSSLVAVARRPG